MWSDIPCKEWNGKRNDEGYGYLCFEGRTIGAHRFAWQQVNGPIPPKMCICHHCDNKACYEISHLFMGTKGDNNRDRAKKRYCGPPLGNAFNLKITDSQLEEIRARLKRGDKQKDIAADYKVHYATISRIKNGSRRSLGKWR